MKLSKAILIVCIFAMRSVFADSREISSNEWNSWVDEKIASQELPVITGRLHRKKARFQVLGTLGLLERKDFNNHYLASLAGRYYFTEVHAWEFLRVTHDESALSANASQFTSQTGYRLNARQAPWSVSTGYIFAPVYGKYAFSEGSVIHFDGYAGASVGLRFASGQTQPTFEPVIGMNHYLSDNLSVILPEIRFRLYNEKRSPDTFVTELMVQAGVSWIF